MISQLCVRFCTFYLLNPSSPTLFPLFHAQVVPRRQPIAAEHRRNASVIDNLLVCCSTWQKEAVAEVELHGDSVIEELADSQRRVPPVGEADEGERNKKNSGEDPRGKELRQHDPSASAELEASVEGTGPGPQPGARGGAVKGAVPLAKSTKKGAGAAAHAPRPAAGAKVLVRRNCSRDQHWTARARSRPSWEKTTQHVFSSPEVMWACKSERGESLVRSARGHSREPSSAPISAVDSALQMPAGG